MAVRIVKIIKFYAWELAIEERVRELRNKARLLWDTVRYCERASCTVSRISSGHVAGPIYIISVLRRNWSCSCATSFGTWSCPLISKIWRFAARLGEFSSERFRGVVPFVLFVACLGCPGNLRLLHVGGQGCTSIMDSLDESLRVLRV